MIAGLDEPTSGTVSIGEEVVNGVDPGDRDIAMVFQRQIIRGLTAGAVKG